MNIGAIKKMWIFSTNEAKLIFLNNGFESCNVQILGGVDIDDCLVRNTHESLIPKVESNDDDNCGAFEISVSGRITEIDSDARALANKTKQPCVVVLENFIGNKYVFGSESQPMFPSQLKRTQPQKIQDNTGYDFSLAAITWYEPPIVSDFV